MIETIEYTIPAPVGTDNDVTMFIVKADTGTVIKLTIDRMSAHLLANVWASKASEITYRYSDGVAQTFMAGADTLMVSP